jgi:hypothetical protein
MPIKSALPPKSFPPREAKKQKIWRGWYCAVSTARCSEAWRGLARYGRATRSLARHDKLGGAAPGLAWQD